MINRMELGCVSGPTAFWENPVSVRRKNKVNATIRTGPTTTGPQEAADHPAVGRAHGPELVDRMPAALEGMSRRHRLQVTTKVLRPEGA